MDWFRMYHEFATDPKVQSMPEAMQRRLVMLMCLRCSNVLGTLQETDICFALRIDETQLAETKALFVRKHFIDEDWEILQWDKRQKPSDSSTERVRKHREKGKQFQEQSCNVTATAQSREEEKREEKSKPRAARTKSRKTAMPENFGVSERVVAWAAEHGYGRLHEHFDSFVRKVEANGYTYVDWDSALMNAIRDDWAKINDKPKGSGNSTGLVL
jgi:hypothetical protein